MHRNAAGKGWGKVKAVDDTLLVRPALDFARQAAASGSPFLAALFTSGSHFPFRPHVLKRTPRNTSRFVSNLRGDYVDGGKLPDYLERLRESDGLVRSVFEGLEANRALAGRVLFIVVGDHGEHFAENGLAPLQHGGCVELHCVRVPLVIYDPFRAVASQRERGAETPRWVPGPHRHADISVSILHWAGVPLPTTPSPALRPGKQIWRGPRKRCVPVFGFFDREAVATACHQDNSSQLEYAWRDTTNAMTRQQAVSFNPLAVSGVDAHDPARRSSSRVCQRARWSEKCFLARKVLLENAPRYVAQVNEAFQAWRNAYLKAEEEPPQNGSQGTAAPKLRADPREAARVNGSRAHQRRRPPQKRPPQKRRFPYHKALDRGGADRDRNGQPRGRHNSLAALEFRNSKEGSAERRTKIEQRNRKHRAAAPAARAVGRNSSCEVKLMKQTSQASCILGHSFDCLNSSAIWVANCRGRFRCGSGGKRIRCGFPPGLPRYICSCTAEDPWESSGWEREGAGTAASPAHDLPIDFVFQ